MNTIASHLRADIEEEVRARGSWPAYQSQALRHLQLKTVIKESHACPIRALAFNQTTHACNSSPCNIPTSMHGQQQQQQQLSNLFATVGGNQATVYDDAHMGEYVAVVAHFCNVPTRHHPGGELSCCAWVNACGLGNHPHGGDAWLAVAGADPVVQLLSVVEARVVAQARGHACEVVALSAARAVPGLLLSLSRDGNLRLWDLRPAATAVGSAAACVADGPRRCRRTVRCLASLETDASTAELHPEGRYMLTGHRNGRMRLWPLPLASSPTVQGKATAVGRASVGFVGSEPGQGLPSSRAPGPGPDGSEEGHIHGGPLAAEHGIEQQAADWELRGPGGGPSDVDGQDACTSLSFGLALSAVTLGPPGPLTETIDSVAFLSRDRFAAKALDGRIHIWSMHARPCPLPAPVSTSAGGWNRAEGALPRILGLPAPPPGQAPAPAAGPPAMQLLASLRVPGSGSASQRARVLLSCTADGANLCVGTGPGGGTAVYDSRSGKCAAELESGKSGSVLSCGLSHDCRHLLAAVGKGAVVRFEYVRPAVAGGTEASGVGEGGAAAAGQPGDEVGRAA